MPVWSLRHYILIEFFVPNSLPESASPAATIIITNPKEGKPLATTKSAAN